MVSVTKATGQSSFRVNDNVLNRGSGAGCCCEVVAYRYKRCSEVYRLL